MQLELAEGTPSLPAPARRHAGLRWLDGTIGFVVEAVAALLVVAEVVVLLAGVVSRYVFHAPIVWSDEL
ncbi:ABC transporter permease, partial [Methylobacterium sp. EM32]